eukprot:c26616_g1_i1 orf=587-1735(-)
MVVCKCRKATKLYCFVHKVPVCGECICSTEHQICVVRTYAEWVIDGDYDWPPKCIQCHEILKNEDSSTTRLGCLHVLHSPCLVSYLQSLPHHTAPAGYICPVCSAPVWPPKSIKDRSSILSTKLMDVISQSGLSKTLLGSDTAPVQHNPPSAFSSAPLVSIPINSTTALTVSSEKSNSGFSVDAQTHDATIPNTASYFTSTSLPASRVNEGGISSSRHLTEVDGYPAGFNGPHSSLDVTNLSKMGNSAIPQLGATRKFPYRGDKIGSANADNSGGDDDGMNRKYSRRGPAYRQLLKYLLPFWSPALPSLPVTTTPRRDDRDALVAEELIEGRPHRRQRSSAIDPRKVLLVFAIMSCMATIVLLYYRLSQGAANDDLHQVEEH